jgi:predicted NBD/HSP70 family sugar kinase
MTGIAKEGRIALSQPVMKKQNLSMALNLMVERRRVSRSDLARAMGLSKPAITRIVAELIAAGYAHETSVEAGSGRGRPAQYIEIRPGRRCFVGFDLRLDRLAICARDMSGEIVEMSFFDSSAASEPAGLFDFMETHLRRLEGVTGMPFSGIGISIPGRLKGWPFVEELARRFGPDCPPVHVADVAQCAAIAGWNEVSTAEDEDLVHLQMGLGAGLGYAGRRNADLMRASNRFRIAHLPMLKDGPVCTCGARGCLDAVASFTALEGYAAPCGIDVAAGPKHMNEYCEELRRLHEGGDPAATEAILTVADWLGRSGASVMNLLAPSRMTIGGYPLALGTVFRDRFLQTIEEYAPGASARVVETPFGDDASIIGAVALAMHDTLADPLTKPAAPVVGG